MNKRFAYEMRKLRREQILVLAKDFKREFATQQNPIPKYIVGQRNLILKDRRGRFISKYM